MNIKSIRKFAASVSAAFVLTFSIGSTAVFAADDDSADTVSEAEISNVFSDADSIKGARTWDNSDSAAAGYAVMSIAAFGAALAVVKTKKAPVSEEETDSDNE